MKALALGALLLGSFAFAQGTSTDFKPSEVQSLRLQVKIKDAQLAQKESAEAQQKLQSAIQSVNQEVESIKTENKWPAGVNYNFQTQTFTAPPPPPAEKPAEKK